MENQEYSVGTGHWDNQNCRHCWEAQCLTGKYEVLGEDSKSLGVHKRNCEQTFATVGSMKKAIEGRQKKCQCAIQ